ncbi:MAG TPA: RDD family protein [Saprospiraceae bacterium]|nr:RDD family protein [Saprospiraceae bacterium]MCB9328626.1 RDD family protein [Lewinellaceae bacterium]HRX29241.1 RDD family protein [Saprospiraceae bacterium]
MIEGDEIILAGFFRRFVAYIIDMIPIFFITFNFIMPEMKEEFNLAVIEQRQVDDSYVLAFNLTTLLIWIGLCIAFESSKLAATPGKLLMKIKVKNMGNSPLTQRQVVIRNVTKIFSQMAFSLGFIWIIIDPMKQGWHDKIAKTIVVQK